MHIYCGVGLLRFLLGRLRLRGLGGLGGLGGRRGGGSNVLLGEALGRTSDRLLASQTARHDFADGVSLLSVARLEG